MQEGALQLCCDYRWVIPDEAGIIQLFVDSEKRQLARIRTETIDLQSELGFFSPRLMCQAIKATLGTERNGEGLALIVGKQS